MAAQEMRTESLDRLCQSFKVSNLWADNIRNGLERQRISSLL